MSKCPQTLHQWRLNSPSFWLSLVKTSSENHPVQQVRERAKKTTPPSRPHLFPLHVFQFWLQETEEKRLTSVFFGCLNSSLLRSHSCSHFHNCRLYIRQKQDGSTSLHGKKELCSGPQGRAVTGQNAMYMTDIKNRWNQTIEIMVTVYWGKYPYLIINTGIV